MRRPGHTGELRARAVFGVEVIWEVFADRAARLVLDLPEAVRRARGHEARLARGQVVQVDAQTVRGVLHGHDDAVARIHEEIRCAVRREGAHGRVDRARRGVRDATLGDEGEVDRFDAREVLTRFVQLRAVEVVDLQTVDVQGRAPEVRVAAQAGGPARPARRIELHFHEGGPRMRGDAAVSRDVRVAVRDARDAGVDRIGG